MSFEITCQNCESKLEAEDSMVGEKLNCPNCGELIEVSQKKMTPDGFLKIFSHYELPGVCFNDPRKFLELFGNTKSEEILNNIWKERSQESCEDSNFAINNPLSLKHNKYKDTLIINFVFPPPKEITESYYLTFIYSEAGEVMCFSLEKGMNMMTKEDCMYLIRLTPTSRGNMGPREMLTFDQYINLLTSLIDSADKHKQKSKKKSIFNFWKK